MANPGNPLSYWALHTTHAVVSAIGVGGLCIFTYLSEVVAKTPLPGSDVAAVWVVGLPLFGYFVSKIQTQAVQETTQQASNAAQASSGGA
ncbi:MAG: hypothetical protein JRN62_10070 [Nitrososphaerota archaeon]|jgi:hypothetical protein|nr:hypothetical protein [Nitrososphaerota archaeon]MDG6949810.1 hypothetical protein [Nitrososphaerota archaeon]